MAHLVGWEARQGKAVEHFCCRLSFKIKKLASYNLKVVYCFMPFSGKQLVKMLQKDGWYLDRISGSHHIMAKGNKTISVPVHGNKSLGKGIESKLLKQAGLKK